MIVWDIQETYGKKKWKEGVERELNSFYIAVFTLGSKQLTTNDKIVLIIERSIYYPGYLTAKYHIKYSMVVVAIENT